LLRWKTIRCFQQTPWRIRLPLPSLIKVKAVPNAACFPYYKYVADHKFPLAALKEASCLAKFDFLPRAKARGFLQAAYAALRLPLTVLKDVPTADSKRLTHRWRFHRRASGFRGVAPAPCPFEEPKSSMLSAALASAYQTQLHLSHTALCRTKRLMEEPQTAHFEDVLRGST
jgi:hypothetical protein